ncbi:MAG: RagB/SusD family nutrient uptake outer membrane protein [Tannerellaceae bacterium]|nr:RagB/SusD family nutrient uptake outer membrane protein [Tannerellaceae bacterium]
MFTSCGEGFLDVQSPTQLYVDEYYNSQERIFEALVAAYDPLQWLDYAWAYTTPAFLSDIMSDDVYVGGSDANDQLALHRMFNYNSISSSLPDGIWTALYSGVNRCNIVAQYMDGIPDISETNKALYLAEAKVLQVFYYKWLWKFWGNIPYYDQNLTFPYLAPQYKADEVYESMITALEGAIATGGLPMKADPEWYGRVTKAMAYMLYAEIVMYQNDESRYSTALKYMEEIISSGQYGLMDDFANIWEATGEWSEESIYEITYFSENGARGWNNQIADGGTVYPKLIGIYNLTDNAYFDGGWGFEPVRETTYMMYDAADKRRDGGILNFATFSAETGASYEPRYQDEGYFLRKYLPRKDGNKNQVGDADMNYDNNTRVYRFSEVLLNAAELLVKGTSGSGSAQTYLDRVRTRAGLASVSATLDNIIEERHLEFVGEGKRYWDLIRTGKASSVLIPDGKYRTNSWSESKKYLPIPQGEMDADDNLVQNPY